MKNNDKYLGKEKWVEITIDDITHRLYNMAELVKDIEGHIINDIFEQLNEIKKALHDFYTKWEIDEQQSAQDNLIEALQKSLNDLLELLDGGDIFDDIYMRLSTLENTCSEFQNSIDDLYSRCDALDENYLALKNDIDEHIIKADPIIDRMKLPTVESAVWTSTSDYSDGEWSLKYTFAMYSKDEQTLRFYSRNIDSYPTVGKEFDGHTCDAIYTGFLTTQYASIEAVPWHADLLAGVTTVIIEDKIAPIATDYWFMVGDSESDSQGASISESGVDLEKLSGENLISMKSMFYGCKQLKFINGIEQLDVSGVSDFSAVFYNCYELETHSLVDWNVVSGVTFKNMFGNVKMGFSGPSYWNNTRCTDLHNMFYNCAEMEQIDFSSGSFTTHNVTDFGGMFKNCYMLNAIYAPDGADWCEESYNKNAIKSSEMFNGCVALPEYSDDNSNDVLCANTKLYFTGV